MVDVGDVPVEAGDEVVLIGRQGDDEITATEWAERLGTISYEIVTRHRRPRPAARTSGERAEQMAPQGAEAHRARSPACDRGRARARLRDRARAGRAPAPPRRSRRRRRRSVPVFDEARILDSHDGGTIYIISRGDGPPIVFCARRHAVVARVGQAVRDVPGGRVPRRRVRLTAATASRRSATPATRSTTSPTTCAPCSRRSTCATRCSSATRWAAWRCRRSPSATPTSSPSASPGIVLLSTSSHNLRERRRRASAAALERVVNVGPDVGTFMRQRNLGLLLARIGFGDDPHPSHVEATRQMLAACARRPRARRRRALLAPRPHRGPADDRTCRRS